MRSPSRRLRSLSSNRLFLSVVGGLLTLVLLYQLFGKSDDDWISFEPNAHFELLKPQVERSLNITIVFVIEQNTDLGDYATATNSVECYAAQHNYTLRIIRDSEFANKCTQKDMMFRRHCVVAEILPTTDWLLFLDADMAVVNPNRLIEEFIDHRFDITFYDRFFNWEVAAGSYIVKNSKWAIKFLKKFADYEQQLPESFHGTDNGALHAFLAETLYPDLRDEVQVCLRIWQQSNGYSTLFLYEGCMRAVMGLRGQHAHVRIIKKGRGWVRDIWLTDSRWSEQGDFMLHALQDKKMGTVPQNFIDRIRQIGADRFTWYNPFKRRLDVQACREGREIWEYDSALKVSKWDIDRKLSRIAKDVEKERWTALASVAEYIL